MMFLLSIFGWLFPGLIKEKMAAKLRIQEQKNLEYVFSIINGYRASGHVERNRDEVKKSYKDWLILKDNLFKQSSKDVMKVWDVAKENNFKCFDLKFIYHLPIRTENFPVEIFQSGCFTEPFHSSPDMQDFILLRDVNKILILRNIAFDRKRRFCVYIKDHFVNHGIAKGIISFDIYEVVE